MTRAEFYTSQFYTWEYRGRGWHFCEYPVYLEAPFMPYYRHGYPEQYVDDGKHHTLVSKFLTKLKGEDTPVYRSQHLLDYETLEPFAYKEVPELSALHVKFSKERKIPPEKMKALLVMLSNINAPISFEIIGIGTEIIVQFVCDETYVTILETYVSAYFPACSLIRSDAFIDSIIEDDRSIAVVDFGLRHEFVRPLHMPGNFSMDPLMSFMAILERLNGNERAGMQILFQSTVNEWSDSIIRSVTMYDKTSFFIDVPEAPKLALDKVHSLLFAVTIRTFSQATELEDAFGILENLSFAITQASKGTFNELTPLSDQTYDFETMTGDIYMRESHRLGMLLNVDELISLLHFPSEHISSKKLLAKGRKTKEVPRIAQDKEYVVGLNVHNGEETEVTFGIDERLKHTHIIGATGTGKSTLIANLLLQDVAKGLGAILFDPHGDLVDDVIARMPQDRIADVALIDPSDIEYPIGLNILQAHSDIEKEVLASDLVAVFKKYTSSWGDQMNTIVSNAILAVLESKDGGSLHDLRRFLIEKDYRSAVLRTVTDPAVLYYWQKEYPLAKGNSIGSILTRLNTFLRPKAIRNMVVQKKGLDFVKLLNDNKIILLKLSQGLIGIENSFLLGSLILSKLHQAILQRQEQATRNPLFMYLDEFQHFITPSVTDMISGIRKYNVGLTLSHQDLQQLQRESGELLNTILGNINTRIVFRVGEPDAKRLQDGFSGFDYTDFQNLGKGEAIIRIEQPQYDCSLDTTPLTVVPAEEKQNKKATVLQSSRDNYATPRSIIEASLYESFDLDKEKSDTKETRERDVPVSKEIIPEKPIAPHFRTASVSQELSSKNQDVSTHRYLQTLVKKMAESRGYTATLEVQLPDGTGQVDVLLSKEGKTIAVEICNTTEVEWEVHNISKCIHAGYTHIVSLSGDIKQLEKIKKRCGTDIAEFEQYSVFFYTPDALFSFLDESQAKPAPEAITMKGYRVNVSYDAITKEDMERKRASVSQVVRNTLQKRKKKE